MPTKKKSKNGKTFVWIRNSHDFGEDDDDDDEIILHVQKYELEHCHFKLIVTNEWCTGNNLNIVLYEIITYDFP